MNNNDNREDNENQYADAPNSKAPRLWGVLADHND